MLTHEPVESHNHDPEEEDEVYVDYNFSTPGAAPGTLNIPDDALPTDLVLIDYDRSQCVTKQLTSPEEFAPYLDQHSVSWIDARGLGSEPVLRRMAEILKLHPLLLEDVVNVPHRPKIDFYKNHLLIIVQMVRSKDTGSMVTSEQVSFVLGKDFLVTFQEEPNWDCFEPVRDRLQRNVGVVRHQRADYLAYSLLDTIIDGYFPILEDFGETIEDLENEVVGNPTSSTVEKIHRLRRGLMKLRRFIWPQRTVLNTLIRDQTDLISPEVRVYLQDCYDHVVQILDILENYREICAGLMDVYLSSVSNRMNEVMKLLTVISTIFIPLTFVAGVYGMNFNPEASPLNMPELNWYWGYVGCWTVMLAIAITLIYFFWRRGWFENFSTTRR